MESQKDIQKDVKVKKTEKLVTAVFMVTGLMDRDEPLRTELRTLSLSLISGSEASSGSRSFASLIPQLMSLINIATSINLISDMNGAILNKELAKLNDSFPGLESFNFSENTYLPDRQILSRTTSQGQNKLNNNVVFKTQMSVIKRQPRSEASFESRSLASSASKTDRRENILKLIREKKEVTIKDISSNISDCSEKTIQRELTSLLKDKVIQKTGEKRWSRYFMA